MVKGEEKEKFGDLLRMMREEAGHTQESFGLLLGLSTKTISRWELGETIPGKYDRHGVVNVLGAGYPEYRERVGLSLGLEIEDAPAPPPGPNMAILKAALDGALFEATEKLGAPPQKVREAVALVLERVALLGLDPKTAAKLVSGT
jgi:transcriptional regulator with XRE-family HTH domain